MPHTSPAWPGALLLLQVVAIADPPRAGLHKSVVRALLACRNITRLVFVSCNPDSLTENVAQLCSPHGERRALVPGRQYWQQRR
jgi:tRNA/tmRNA/rRNA uracil-C5-methylase (TrmA/RlmC/RlmD family)